MTGQPQAEEWSAIDRRQLTTMMDKLVAIQLDLKPLCDDAESKQEAKTRSTVIEACNVLQSAIDDLRQVIFQLEGLSGLMGSAPSTKGSGSE